MCAVLVVVALRLDGHGRVVVQELEGPSCFHSLPYCQAQINQFRASPDWSPMAVMCWQEKSPCTMVRNLLILVKAQAHEVTHELTHPVAHELIVEDMLADGPTRPG